MYFFYFILSCLLIFWMICRYIGWAVSRLIAWYFGLNSVRIGRFRLFHIEHLKLGLDNGLLIEVDDVRISSGLFNSELAKPLMILANDVRIEGESRQYDNFSINSKFNRFNVMKLLKKQYFQWLEHIGVKINTTRIVYLEALSGCLLHSTFEMLQLDTFRDREGIQLEFNCRLAQAKLLRRIHAANSVPLFEFSIEFLLSLSVTLLMEIKLKKAILSLNNPVLSFSDSLFEYVKEHPVRLDKRNQNVDRLSNSSIFEILPSNLKLVVGKLTVRYIAYADIAELTKLSTISLKSIIASTEDCNRISIALAGILVSDHSPLSFSCADFVINLVVSTKGFQTPIKEISLYLRVFDCWLNILETGVVSWIEYFHRLKQLIFSNECFDDDFSHNFKFDEAKDDSETNLASLWNWAVSTDISNFNCQLITADQSSLNIGMELISFTANESLKSIEFGIEYLCMSRGQQREEHPQFKFEHHVWGNAIMIGALLAQYIRQSDKRLLQIQVDEIHVEYEDQIVQQVASFVSAIFPKNSPLISHGDTWSETMPDVNPLIANLIIQASIQKSAFFVVSRQAAFVVFSAGQTNLSFLKNFSSFSLLINELIVSRGLVSSDILMNWNNDGKLVPEYNVGYCSRLNLRCTHCGSCNQLVISFESDIHVSWQPLLHIVLLEFYRIVTDISKKFLSKQHSASVISPRLYLNIDSNYSVYLDFHLPQNRIMRWEAPSLHVHFSDVISFSMPQIVVSADSHNILTIKKFDIQRRAADTQMDLGRAEFKNLSDRTNRVWLWTADSVDFLFPFNYDFASFFDEVVNIWKWIKLVHNVKKTSFTIESPLPSDLNFFIKRVSFQINDDPFEVKLQSNYELLIDEAYECERRRQMLNQKLDQLRKFHPFLPRSKVEELHQSLIKKNAEIYIERSRKSSTTREHLVLWTVTNFSIRAYADRILHGRENALKYLRMFNPESAFPEDEMEFNTLWCRAVELDYDDWVVQLRDYPLPYVAMKDGHFWGHLVGAEQLAGNRSTRHCLVNLPPPWNDYIIDRNMCPLKFYYDLESEICDTNCTYGPCWEPCLSMISICWNNIIAVSRDRSPPLPFWDKVRLLLHGRLSMLCRNLITAMLASTDPYNANELVEISWKNFEFDWTAGQFCVQTDLNAFVRTASKYDESRVLHLPALKFSIQVSWKCLGDPHDHHSVHPCAPNKLPDYSSTNLEHDSYRAFRSMYFDLVLNFEVKQLGDLMSDNQYPHILLYANTFRWLEFLKNTMTTVNRPVKRGTLFGSTFPRKTQLSQHCKHLQLSLSLPKFLISYWMSFSSSHGFRMISEGLYLTTSMEFFTFEKNKEEQMVRRGSSKWLISFVSAQLINMQMHLFGDNLQPMNDKFATDSNDDSFFLGLSRLSYVREASQKQRRSDFSHKMVMHNEVENNSAVHRITMYDLRASWTPENRDTCLVIADGIQKAQILRRILSNDIMKALNIQMEESNASNFKTRSIVNRTPNIRTNRCADSDRSPLRSEGRLAEENDMLQRLIDEAETKLVAYSEEATDVPSDLLRGIALCNMQDVFLVNWQIDLINSQAMLRGKDKDGFVLLTAAKASVTQRLHLPVWKKSQLLCKKSWCAVLSGMQYFAPLLIVQTVSSSKFSDKGKHRFHWLPKEVIEEKTCSDANLGDRLDNYINAGEAVGGVVADRRSGVQNGVEFQLQRIVSRCSCQTYFCYYSDTLDMETYNVPPPAKLDDHDKNQIEGQEAVDCFTLKHNMLEVSTNPQQYEMVMNIVNQHILFVDPRKKESEGRRQRLRFQLQLKSISDIKASINGMQAELRDVIAVIRSLERRSFFLNRQLLDNPNDNVLLEANKEIAAEVEDLKKNQMTLSDELAMTISCYKEKQVERMLQLVDMAEDEHALVARRFEVCFEDCIWRLTESDGQIALAEMQIRNFLYTRTARIDNSGEHLLEIGTVKVTNLLPDSLYKHTLQAQNTCQAKTERQPCIRVVCREMAPVGGISVKEHFEVNVSPMVAQITYRFFEKIMAYFFPGRNIDKEDQQNLDVSDEQQLQQSVSVAQWLRGAVNGSFRKANETNELRDDIDRMKERAQKNNVFLYIKIPEVPFIVSYKGSKEKNIEDVDRFLLALPLCEYHDKNWTWLDLALAIKQRCRRVLLQQYMKQKLLRNRMKGVERAPDEIDEEEKKRIVLGMALSSDKERKSKNT